MREKLLAQTFVEVADTLVNDFDVLEYLSLLTGRCVDLFDLSEAGLMLADHPAGLQVAASSSEQMALLELFELQHDQGPCLDCYRSGRQVHCPDLGAALERWPGFAPEAINAGFGSVFALPMRLREQTIGALNLLRHQIGSLADDDLVAAQALADVATIGLLHHRAAAESRLLTDQLQYALNSRVAIEQATGFLAEHFGLDMHDAFTRLRQYARNHNARLVDVARAVATRDLPADRITARSSTRQR